jgi:triphosphoribosyl-dephospho-CoA synthetase
MRHLKATAKGAHQMNIEELKEEVLRAFILSQSIEPLAEKPGCTTRTVDSSPGTKLEYFIISAVNSAWPMLEVVDRIGEHQGQPDCLFDIAYRAQLKSTRNRNGGKVNYAQILMLLPIITAQCLLFVEGAAYCSVDLILKRVGQSMRATTQKDVEYLQKFVDLSRKQSEEHHQRLGTTRPQMYPRFIGIYSNIMDATEAEDFSYTMVATEIRDGYPQCKYIFHELSNSGSVGLIKRSEEVYHKLLPELIRHDIVADCIVVGIYLTLIQNRSEILFP